MDATRFTRALAPTWKWVALIAGVSCSFGNGERALEFSVTHTDAVESHAAGPVQLPPEPTAVQGGAGFIHVRGLIALPDQCDDVAAQVEPGPTLRVTVRGSRTHGAGCGRADRVVMAQYEATLRRIPPGAHRLRIVYDYRGVRAGERDRAAPDDPTARLWRDHEAGVHTVQVE